MFHPIIDRIRIEIEINPRSKIPLKLKNELLALLSIEIDDDNDCVSYPCIEIIPSSLQYANVGQGILAGIAILFVALILDRVVQGKKRV